MSIHTFEELLDHVGHKIEVAAYGPANETFNVAIECMTDGTVLIDYDHPDMAMPEGEPC